MKLGVPLEHSGKNGYDTDRADNGKKEYAAKRYSKPSQGNYRYKNDNRKPSKFKPGAGKPLEKGATVDQNLKLTVTLESGEGRYKQGWLHKKEMVNFKLCISIENQEDLKISKITATLKGRGDQIEKKISTDLESTTEFDLPVDNFGGVIEASVIVVYKIGFFKTKQLKTTVSKRF